MAEGNWLRRYSAIALTAILAAMGWTAVQAINVRDAVTRIDATLPIRLQAIEFRLSNLEAGAARLETRDNQIQAERGEQKP